MQQRASRATRGPKTARQSGRGRPATWQPPAGSDAAWQPSAGRTAPAQPSQVGPASWQPPGQPPDGQPPGGPPYGQSPYGPPGGQSPGGPPGGPPGGSRVRGQPPDGWAHGWARANGVRRRRARWRQNRSHGPLRRPPDGRMLAGVAAAIAARTGFDVTMVRIAIAVLTLAGGTGLVGYVLLWLLLPVAGQDGSIAGRALSDRRGITLAAGLASLLAMLLVIASLLGIGWVSSMGWAMVIAGAGLLLIWRNTDASEQAMLRRIAEPLRGLTRRGRASWTLVRVAVAFVVLIAGLAELLPGPHKRISLQPLGGVVLVIAAIVIAFGPWWLRIARDLVTERQARIRAEERADMAARVHDSVLQTLALIQRQASQPQQVIQLARAQERELRSWLFDGRPPGSLDSDGMTVAAGVRTIQQEVEASHGITVEAVTVGDCQLDDGLRALLAAGREATVNAAKWSGAPTVSVFAEVEPAMVSLFVRDRGKGFDPQAVPADRKGLAESIHGRMARRGGTAAIRSAPGEGTEVALSMPRTPAVRPDSQA